MLFRSGCRGHLGKELIQRFDLDAGKQPQHYALGLKEIWELPTDSKDVSGSVIHSAGWPLSLKAGRHGTKHQYQQHDVISHPPKEEAFVLLD